jgi:hypothetical protein
MTGGLKDTVVRAVMAGDVPALQRVVATDGMAADRQARNYRGEWPADTARRQGRLEAATLLEVNLPA